MKKSIRILSVLTVLFICLYICGCDVLDDLRASRATITEDGTIKFVDGSEYKELPECKELSPSFDNYDSVYLADEELPLLLTTFSDNTLLRSDDGIFLESYVDDKSIYYCRTDVYNDVLDRINGGFIPEAYGYFYYENMEKNFYILTQSQVDAVLEVCRTQTPENLSEAATLDYEYMVDLFVCTKDKLFMQDTVDVYMINGKYYVVSDDDFGITALYSVPDNLSKEFESILEKEKQTENYY